MNIAEKNIKRTKNKKEGKMAIYKNWKAIAEFDNNFLKLRLLVEENQEKLAEFQKLYPELFCDESVNLRIPKSLVIQKSIEAQMPFEDEDDKEGAEDFCNRIWTDGCYEFGIPVVELPLNYFDYWLYDEFLEKKGLENNINDFVNFKTRLLVSILGKKFIIIDNDTVEEYFRIALAEHIDMNS